MTNSRDTFETLPDDRETTYITAMSRPRVVDAYTRWGTTSEAEDYSIGRYLPKKARVLDLGCGAARMIDAYGDRFASYLGVDGSSEMINAAKSKHPKHQFQVTDITKLAVPSGSYDAVLLMHNVIDSLSPFVRRRSVLEISRKALSTKGVLICSSHFLQPGNNCGYYSEDYHGVQVSNYRSNPSDFCREIENAGFNIELLMKDTREGKPTDWMYAVGTPRD